MDSKLKLKEVECRLDILNEIVNTNNRALSNIQIGLIYDSVYSADQRLDIIVNNMILNLQKAIIELKKIKEDV